MVCAVGGFADLLRALMGAQGVSVAGLARLVPCDKALISRYRSGQQAPSQRMADRIDDVLGAGGRLALLAGRSPGDGLNDDDRARLAWTASHPRQLDTSAVGSLAVLLNAQRHAEDVLGSAAIMGPVTSHLASVTGLAAEARGPVREALVDVAGQWAQFAGWLHASLRDDAGAIRLNQQALELATEAANASLASEVISMTGHVHWLAGRPGAVIGLSRAAQRDLAAFPGQHAISAAQEARGYAMTGDAEAAERKLDDALDHAAAAEDHAADAPPWLYYHSASFFELQRGIVLGYFAAEPRYRDIAAAALESGYAGLAGDERGSEWGAGYLVHLAAVHERAGDLEHAAATAARAARVARRSGSPRLRELLRPLAVRLAARLPHDPAVAEVADALR